jgi:hypothetical protein
VKEFARVQDIIFFLHLIKHVLLKPNKKHGAVVVYSPRAVFEHSQTESMRLAIIKVSKVFRTAGKRNNTN